MTQKTGQLREEIPSRLQRDLPRAVNDLTPDGRIPTEEQFGGFGSVDMPQTSLLDAGRGI